jgi:hypothetical protein
VNSSKNCRFVVWRQTKKLGCDQIFWLKSEFEVTWVKLDLFRQDWRDSIEYHHPPWFQNSFFAVDLEQVMYPLVHHAM